MNSSIRVLVVLMLPLQIYAQTTSEKIYDALENGRISQDEAIRYLGNIVENRTSSIPQDLRSDIPDKCGFPILATVLSATQARTFQRKSQSAAQKTYIHSFSTSRGMRSFQFFYDTTGTHAIPLLDADFNSIPDWLQEAGIAAERSYRLEVDTLGYREPLDFGIYGRYTMYFVNMPQTYGQTYLDSLITQNPDTYTSSMDIENDFNGFYTTGYDALRVTIAHEFHHAIQLAYVANLNEVWFYELTSTWMEDVVFDEVNDYYAYLPSSFGSPEKPLDICEMTGLRCGYHIAQFFHLLEKKHGRTVIRRSWEKFTSQTALTALDGSLEELTPSNLKTEFSDFTIWNYFTGSRANPTYYPEGQFYPRVKFDVNRTTIDTAITRSLDHLASRYYAFEITDTVNAEIAFNSLSPGFFNVITIEYNPLTAKRFVNNHGSDASIVVSTLLPGDSLTVIVANRELSGLSTQYALDIAFVNAALSGASAITDIRFFPSPLLLRNSSSNLFLRFRLAQSTDISFEIFSTAGKLVHRRVVPSVSQGPHDGRFESDFSWNGRDPEGKRVSSGVYFYRLKGSGFEKMGKIAVVR